jgi:DNA-binding MarR family transcriptional regulator
LRNLRVSSIRPRTCASRLGYDPADFEENSHRMATTTRARRSNRNDISGLLSYRLVVVSTLLTRSQLARFAAVSYISLSEWRTLALVGSFGPLSVKSLSRHAGLDFGQTSRLASAMCANGLIEKARAEDGRSVTLALTDEGRALRRRLWAVAMRCNAEFLDSLGAADRKGLLSALDKLAAKAKATLGHRKPQT